MRMQSLIKVAVDKNTATLSFGDWQEVAINLQPDGNAIKKPSVVFLRHSNLPNGVCAVKTFFVEGKVYAQGSDKRIYVFEKSVWTPLGETEFNFPVNIISIIYEGEKRLLIFSADKAILKGLGEEEVVLPQCEQYAYTAGMLFMAKGNVLRFSKPFNFTDFTVDLQLGGYLEMDNEYGEIVGLKGEGDGVIIVCKNGIAKLTTVGERTEYSLKKYQLPYIDVAPKSFTSTTDAICFISENAFYVFKNGKLTKDELPFKRSDMVITDSAVFARGFYLLPMQLKGVDTDYVYCRKSSNNGEAFKQGFLFDGKVALSSDGGFAGDKMTNAIYRLSFSDEQENSQTEQTSQAEQEISTAYYKSRAIDFSVHEKKFITDIKVDCVGSFTLKVSGDFGTATFGVEAGRSHIKCNLQSESYVFEVVGNAKTQINALSVIYRI